MKKLLILLGLSSLILSACNGGEEVSIDLDDAEKSGAIEYMESTSHDWGDISIEGGLVTYSFPYKNTGDSPLVLKSMATSCMCTSAELELSDGRKSPIFGMHGNTEWNRPIGPGEEFQVNVSFDPMAHGPDAVGVISRSVMLMTSADNVEEGNVEMKVSANVLYEKDFQKLN
jgi:hypothetical protein